MAVKGVRNKNPGCLRCKGTAGQDSGGFAIYNTWEEGYYALNSVLYRIYNGKSLRQIFKAYAPASEKGNNPGKYSLMVAASLKEAGINVSPNEPIDMTNPRIRAEVVCAIAEVECGQIPKGRDFALKQSYAYDPAMDPRVKGKSMNKKAPLKTKKPVSTKAKTTARKAGDEVQVVTRKKTKPTRSATTLSAPNYASSSPNISNPSTTPIKGPYILPGQQANMDKDGAMKAALLEEYKDKTPPKKLSWLSRILPPSLGGASKEARILDEIFYPKNKENIISPDRELFVGFTVKDLNDAGFGDGEIVNMQARIDVKQEMVKTGDLTARLAEAGTKCTMTGEELGVTNDQMAVITSLAKGRSGNA